MKFTNRISKAALAATMLALLSACGGTAYKQDGSANQPYGVPTTLPGPLGGPGTLGGSAGDASQNFLPSYTTSFQITGSGGDTPTYTTDEFQTDSILKVRVTAGPAGQVTVPGYSYSATYSCVQYTVNVLGESWTTQPLSTGDGGGCNPYDFYNPYQAGSQPDASHTATSDVHDFSGRLTQGTQNVTVQITSARYDFYCQLWWQGFIYGTYSMYCPMHTVYKTHTVTGTLDIQVNGTQ